MITHSFPFRGQNRTKVKIVLEPLIWAHRKKFPEVRIVHLGAELSRDIELGQHHS